MKKRFLIGSAVLIMALPLAVFAANQGSGNPQKGGAGSGPTNPKGNANGSLGAGYEKIPAPWAINSYDHITQVGNALWGKMKPKTGDSQGGAQISGKLSASGLACFGGALDTQDAAILAAVTAQSAADQTSMSAKTACMKAALIVGGTDVITQLQACGKTFMDAQQASAKTASDAVSAARTQYLTDAKACVTNNPTTDTTAADAGKVFAATQGSNGEQGNNGPMQGGNGSQGGGNGGSNGFQSGMGSQGGQGTQTGDKGSRGGQGGTGQLAINACAGLAQSAACTFTTSKGGKVTGTCQTTPNNSGLLSCMPAAGSSAP